jgi:hypothetical protein
VEAAGAQKPRAQPIVEVLSEIVRRHGLPAQRFLDLIDAREEEIEGALDVVRAGHALADLQLAVLGVTHEPTRDAARAVGAAWLMGEGPEREALLAEARRRRAGIDARALPILLPFQISPLAAAALGISLNSAAFSAEIYRGGIQSIEHGQWDGARALGMSWRQAMRRIILPQAARTAVPPLSNTLISLVKDTSLASTILVTELFRTAQNVAAPTFEFFALYGTAAVYYWVICLVLSFGQSRLENRLERYVAR